MTADSTARALPNGWSWRQLDEVAELLSGGTPPKNDASLWTGEVPWISPKDMKKHQLDTSADAIAADAARRFSRVVPAATTFVVIRGMILARDIPICLTMRPMAFNQDVKAIVPKAGINGAYLSFAIASQKRALQADIGTAAHGTRRIGSAALEKLKVPVPADRMEQSRIAKALLTLLHRRELQASRLASLRVLKAATMAKLFQEGLNGRARIDSAVGRIPNDWNITMLGSLCSPEGGIQTGPFGSQLHAHDYLPDGVPIINPTHIAEGRVIETEIPRISHSDATRLSRHALRSGDILFSRRGDVGRHALISDREAGWLCGTGCLLVRPAERAVNSAYLSLFLDTPFAQNFLKAKAAGTIMPNINTKILASIPVARPPLAEQKQIAKHLDCVMRAVVLAKERLDRLEALFATTLARLLTGALRVPSAPAELETVDAS